MLTFATLLATLGILIDNPNVVVGAMLIAPLMTPISSLAVSISKGRVDTMMSSLTHLSLSIAVVIVVSGVLGRLIPVVGVPDEALARARPSFIDLLIAIIAGAAGMYAFLRKDVPESMAGVAVAVALLPPLSVVGLGLAFENWALAVGSTVLFFTNVTAILSASLVVLFFHGKVARSEEEKEVAATGWGVTMVIVVLLTVLLGSVFLNTFREEKIDNKVKATLTAYLEQQSAAKLQSYQVQHLEDQLKVNVVLQLPQDEVVPDVQKMTEALSYALEESVTLNLSLIRTETADIIISPQEKEAIQQVKQQSEEMQINNAESTASARTIPTATTEAVPATKEADL